MSHAIRRTPAEEFQAMYGMDPNTEVDRTPRRDTFVDDEGSDLLRAMQRRLRDEGLLDDRGKIIFERLLEAERATAPIVAEAGAWLEEVGNPDADEWDDFDIETDWKTGRW